MNTVDIRFGGRFLTTILLGALLLLLAACGGTGGGSRQPPLVYPTGGPCLSALDSRQVDYVHARLAGVSGGGSGGCGIDTPISLSTSTADLNAPVRVGCAIALAMNEFERRILQPAAQAHFGQHITRIHHMGGYACRTIAGSRRISQHALGKAIDIGGFELADGRVINVRRHWHGPRAQSAFLRDVARGACQTFNTVLSPSTDAAHHDHFHFDLAPWRHCSV
ncbi:extensin family protein [Fodinicurvata sp. EGI_FJ10296]|uniref:extensin family protein n=1 Tax=Fodinicurvata sp. EGI_FJ10296 TaxID=3231908 RepID=UPI0034527002